MSKKGKAVQGREGKSNRGQAQEWQNEKIVHCSAPINKSM